MYDHETIEKPTLVIAGSQVQYEKYLMENKLTRKEALFVTNPEQLQHYPMDCPIAKAGEFWLNNCDGSKELKARERHLEELSEAAARRADYLPPASRNFVADGNAMSFGDSATISNEQRYYNALRHIADGNTFSLDRAVEIAREALGE